MPPIEQAMQVVVKPVEPGLDTGEATRQPDVAEDDAPNALPVPLLQRLQRDVLALQQDWEYEKGGLRIGRVNVRGGNYRNPYRNLAHLHACRDRRALRTRVEQNRMLSSISRLLRASAGSFSR